MATRRNLIRRVLFWLGVGASYGTAASFGAWFLYQPRRRPRLRLVHVARDEDIPEGGSRLVEDLRGTPVQVVRDAGRIKALSMVCPHLGCRVHWEAEKQHFLCPCHNGVFDREGRVLSGPPPRALDRYDVQLENGNVYLKMKEPA